MRYILIEEETPAELQISVNKAIDKGYITTGGIAAIDSRLFKDGTAYLQAMIKDN